MVHGGPWLFRNYAVVIEDYDGVTDPEEYVLDGLYVWAQIHKVPDLYRQPEVVDELARRIGKVREVQLRPSLYFEGDYVRVRVRVLTAKPLTRFVPLSVEGEGRRMLVVKYEKKILFSARSVASWDMDLRSVAMGCGTKLTRSGGAG